MTDLASAAIECSRIWAEAWVETNAVDNRTTVTVFAMLFATATIVIFLCVALPEKRAYERRLADDRRNREAGE